MEVREGLGDIRTGVWEKWRYRTLGDLSAAKLAAATGSEEVEGGPDCLHACPVVSRWLLVWNRSVRGL